MTKLKLPSNMTRAFHRAGLTLKKHSPEILAVVGVVGTVTSAVMACKATTKLSAIMDEAKDTIDAVHTASENPDFADDYTPEDAKKDLAITYAQTGLKLVKLYGPSVALGVASVGCLLTSNKILRTRNVALAAAYTALDKDYKGYRSRVVERFDKKLDRELKFNIKAKEIEETVINEDGTESTVTRTVEVMDMPNQNDYSPYSIVFDDGNTGWDKDPELTKYFLVQQQNYANDLLKTRGHLFLNEVYDMLGARRTKAGQHVGWVYDEKHPVGDNFVDFGIFDIHRSKARDFVNGYERVIVLDFNVDGDIYKLMA